jgi:nitrite reductase (NADH) small subunit
MGLIPAGRASDLPPGSVREVEVGDELFAVCNVRGAIYAFSGVCPHAGGPLGQGQIEGQHVVCPYHMWEFDVATGEYDRNPACRVATFPVKVEDDRIFLQAP